MGRNRRLLALTAALALTVTACGSIETEPDAGGEVDDAPTESTGDGAADDGAADADGGGEGDAMATPDEFFDQAAYEEELRLRDVEPEGPDDRPWEQMLEPEMVDTSDDAAEGPHHLCFSNASIDNPWRQAGWTTMQAEVDAQGDAIEEFTAVDAEASDEQQISDIQSLLNRDCDAIIVSPNTTAALTPAVETACESGIPVVVFDRGVNTDCPVTFVHPIGGYAFGAAGADFLVENNEEGAKILGLRVLPGVDVLETRWAAASRIFEENGMEVVGAEFTGNDPATAKSTVTDYIQREGQIDGVWMDDGTAAVAVIEAFEDAGLEVPPVTGEDQQAFLDKWASEDLTLVAPTYPTYQWRTAVIAALQILDGEQVPSEWILPQPVITEGNLDQYYVEGLPPLFYAACGCQEMEGFPDRWGG
jgi:ribose transport system substrate-binding protein